MNNRSLSSRITVLVVVPLFAFFGLSVRSLWESMESRVAAIQLQDTGAYFVATSKTVHELQRERGKTALFLGGKIPSSELDSARTSSDEVIKRLQGLLEKSPLSPDVIETTRRALLGVSELRHEASRGGDSANVIAGYSKLIRQLLDQQIRSSMQGMTGKGLGLDAIAMKMLSLSSLELAKENTGRLRASLSGILAADKPITIQQLALIEGLKNAVVNNIESPTLLITDKGRSSLDSFRTSSEWAKVQTVYQTVVQKQTAGTFGEDPQAFFATISKVIDALGEIVGGEVAEVAERSAQAASAAARAFWITVVAMLGLTLLMSFFAWYVIRTTTKELKELANRLSEGAEAVSTSTIQIAQQGEVLSEAANEQTAAVQSTVSAVHEVSTTAQRNAENAKNSERTISESRSAAARGGQTVEEMLHAIEEIQRANGELIRQSEHSNQELSQIIGVISAIAEKTKVINDIVFQTKLLSFNASVEAARAGESGKGFAVVAEEVGKLAQMSGSAADEISAMVKDGTSKVESIIAATQSSLKSLTEESEKKVQEGIGKSRSCGEAFQGLIANIESVGEITVEVSRASEEQTRGVEDINRAMNQIDTANSRNVTIAVESSKAAQMLARRAQDLRAVVTELLAIVNGQGVNSKLG